MPQDLTSPLSMEPPLHGTRLVRPVTLAILVVLTSWAVGVTTSFWLVPVYLASMGWLLMGPSAQPIEGTKQDELATETPEPELSLPLSPEIAPAEQNVPKAASKRGRTRKPKAKAKVEETVSSTIATWVQVAPGKFVRVELPASENEVESSTLPIENSDDVIPPDETVPAEITEAAPIREMDISQPEPVSVEEVQDEPSDESEPAYSEFHEKEENPTIIVSESESDGLQAPDEPNIDSQLVAVEDHSKVVQQRSEFGRSNWVRRESRPKPRRGNGRIGAIPRVVLHRG